jgi:hypothetical protein
MFAVGSSGWLGGNLLVGKRRNVGSIAGVLNRDAADIAVPVEVKDRVLIEIFGFGNFDRAKLNVQRVSILKVLDLHGVNDRSKNALCTVSPSGRRITLKYLPLRFGDRSPPTNSTVLLDHLLYRMLNDELNPGICDNSTVRTAA